MKNLNLPKDCTNRKIKADNNNSIDLKNVFGNTGKCGLGSPTLCMRGAQQ